MIEAYTVAECEVDRSLLLAAGEAILASDLWHGSGAMIGGLLLHSSTLMASMLGRDFVRLADHRDKLAGAEHRESGASFYHK
jgi:hypothetical protein